MGRFCTLIFSRIKKIYQKYFYKKLKIALLGHKDSGKSTLVYALFENKYRENIGSAEVRVSKHILENTEITIYDIPGTEEMKSKWDHYFKKTDVIIYFVDSNTSKEVFECSKEMLHSLLYRNMWMKKNVLVLGTKNDLPNAMMCKDIILALDLFSIVDREVACYSISSKNLLNIDLVKDWIIDQAFLGPEN